jgi:hypothetical protein
VKNPSREPGFVLLNTSRISHVYSTGLDSARARRGDARGRLISRLWRKINWIISLGRDSKREVHVWTANGSERLICEFESEAGCFFCLGLN